MKCTGDFCGPASCDLPLDVGTISLINPCPVTAGDVQIQFDATIAEKVPDALALLDIIVKANSSSGEDLLCAAVHTHVTTSVAV